MTRVLIADDEDRIRDVVEFALQKNGFEVVSVPGGAAAVEQVTGDPAIDLAVLDVLMPDLDGLEVCRRLRAVRPIPVIFLSSRGEETDRIVGLELGGDDYITKPFSPRELIARVRSVLRRAGAVATGDRSRPPAILEHRGLRLDTRRHVAEVDGEPISLTATEFRVVAAILGAGGAVLDRRQLIEQAYPGNHHVAERTVDTHVRRIRRKLRPHGVDPFATVTGVGYREAD